MNMTQRLLILRVLTAMILAGAITHVVAAQAGTTLAVPNRVNSTPWVTAYGSFVAVAWGSPSNAQRSTARGVSVRINCGSATTYRLEA